MDSACYDLIGGYYEMFALSTNLHEISLAYNRQERITYILAHIRLFANLGGPIYAVIVGELPSGISVDEVHARQMDATTSF
jgi:hypothetical protein